MGAAALPPRLRAVAAPLGAVGGMREHRRGVELRREDALRVWLGCGLASPGCNLVPYDTPYSRPRNEQ